MATTRYGRRTFVRTTTGLLLAAAGSPCRGLAGGLGR